MVGFSSSYTSPALASMAQPNSTLHVTKSQESWIGSLLPLSALFGGILGGPMIETLGRKRTILATGPPFILSFLLISFARNVGLVMGGRCVGGVCVGIASLVLPLYLAETLTPEVRGSLGLLPTVFGNGGILVCFIVGKYLDWSQLALLGACLSIPYILLGFMIPETPRWYIGKNNAKAAQKSLQWLRGEGGAEDIGREMAEMQTVYEVQRVAGDAGGGDGSGHHLRPLLVSLGLMFFQQLSGINAVIFYTVKIFQDAGSTIDSNLSAIIVGVVNFASIFVATFLIDRLGRKPLLQVSGLSMLLTLTVLGGYFYVKDEYADGTVDVTPYGWLPLTSFVIFVVGFSIGYGPIPWLMMGEILPAKIRGVAASVTTAFNWSCTFVVTKTFADISASLGSHGAFWLFAVCCAIGIAFVALFVPETRNRTLEDIEKKFRRKPSAVGVDPGPAQPDKRISSIA
ncbi:hypothetical protein AAG570_003806 [Ranatra chinensis]|uniref:Major facilitator superfamily (MFS) profile domain-containing protein n=1 Tax=Ranatra chinensis TaxID=642074 RepID=A0ABD0Y553_9HEMI